MQRLASLHKRATARERQKFAYLMTEKTTISARTLRPTRGLFHFKIGRLSNHDDDGNKNPTNLHI